MWCMVNWIRTCNAELHYGVSQIRHIMINMNVILQCLVWILVNQQIYKSHAQSCFSLPLDSKSLGLNSISVYELWLIRQAACRSLLHCGCYSSTPKGDRQSPSSISMALEYKYIWWKEAACIWRIMFHI